MADARESIDDELTTSQAAGVLGTSVSTFGRYVRDGWITPARTIGRSRLYRRADVDTLHRRLHPHEEAPPRVQRGG